MSRRVTFEDPDLPHQLRVFLVAGSRIAVSCNCRKRQKPLGIAVKWDLNYMWQIYNDHLPRL
jgi:hypothetical protein